MLVGAVRRLAGQGRRSGGAAADQLRRRQDALDAGAVSPVLRHRAHRAGGHRRGDGRRPGPRTTADGQARGAGRQQDLARATPSTSPMARWCARCGASWPGSLGGKQGLRAHRGRRREGHQPRRRAARAVQRVRPLPDPDRRVGGLCPPAPRPERPAGRQLRDAVHLCPGADRVGQAGQELPAGDQPAGLRYHRLAAHPGRRRRGGRHSAGARRSTGCATWSAGWNPPGGRPAPRKASRSCAGGCSSRWSDPAQFKDRDVVARAFADLYRTQQAGVPARVPRRRLREAHQGGLSDPPGDLRPALHRLVDAGEVPAHARRAAPDGGGDPQPVGEGRPQPADPAGQHPDRRPARAVRADPLPLGQLGAGDREGRGRARTRCRCSWTARCPTWASSAACRRVARTIYLGSAPTAAAAHRGLEDRRVKLGCVMPGESPAVFGDALRRLAAAATYLYQDGPRYWYSTQPTVTKLAEDRAEQLKRDPDKVAQELDQRLREDLARRRATSAASIPAADRAQTCPTTSTRAWWCWASTIPTARSRAARPRRRPRRSWRSRGNTPRLYRNTLVFLAADKTRLQDLDEAARKYLAWESILAEKDAARTSTRTRCKQAETQKAAADSAVTARLPETYQWLLVPVQATPQAPVDLAGAPALRAGRPGRARQQEAAERRAAADQLRRHAAAHGAGPRAALARRSRGRSSSWSRTSPATSTCRG